MGLSDAGVRISAGIVRDQAVVRIRALEKIREGVALECLDLLIDLLRYTYVHTCTVRFDGLLALIGRLPSPAAGCPSHPGA